MTADEQGAEADIAFRPNGFSGERKTGLVAVREKTHGQPMSDAAKSDTYADMTQAIAEALGVPAASYVEGVDSPDALARVLSSQLIPLGHDLASGRVKVRNKRTPAGAEAAPEPKAALTSAPPDVP